MAALIDKIKHYLGTPEGKRNVEKAKVMARDLRNRTRLREMWDRFRTRR